MVGDTGFEPVTSSVSTSFTPSAGVRRGPSEHEPLPHRPPTCAHIRTRCHSLSHSPHFLVTSPGLAPALPTDLSGHDQALRLPTSPTRASISRSYRWTIANPTWGRAKFYIAESRLLVAGRSGGRG